MFHDMYNPSKLKQLSLILLGLSFSYATLAYVLSSFLEQLVPATLVGLIFTFGYLLALFLTYSMGHYLKTFGKYHTAAMLFILNVAPLIYLAMSNHATSLLAAVVIYLFSQVALLVLVDIYIQSYSDHRITGAIRGGQLTYMNLGILLGPLLAGTVLAGQPYQKLFLIAATLAFAATLFFLIHFTDDGDQVTKIHEPNFFQMLKSLAGHRHLGDVFAASFLLQFFYSWMIIYSPLYLRHLGFAWSEVGKILFVALIPFVLIQYLVGWLIDRRISEKTMLALAFILIAGGTFALAFLPFNLWWWSGVLFITRIGAAILEVVSDTAFFRRVKTEEINLIDFFRLSRPLAYIAGPVVGSLLLTKLPLSSLFPILAVVMLSGLYFTAHLKKV